MPNKLLVNNTINKEIKEAVTRIENGDFVKHEDALKELSK